MGILALLTLVAEAVPSLDSSVAGWTTALSSGGVLAWLLLKHLPDKAARDEKKDTEHGNRMESMFKIHADAVAQLTDKMERNSTNERAAFTTGLDRVIDHCRQESIENGSMIKESLRDVKAAVERLVEKKP